MNLIVLVSVIAIVISAISLAAYKASHTSNNVFHNSGQPDLMGDYNYPINDTMGTPRASILTGEPNYFFGSPEGEGDLEAYADQVFSGDVSKEVDQIIADLSAGGEYLSEELVGAGAPSNNSIIRSITQAAGNLAKTKESPKDLLAKKILGNISKRGINVKDKARDIKVLETKKNIPGAIAMLTRFRRYTIYQGEYSITSTDLSINGSNFVKALELWQVNYPGLSHVVSKSSVAGVPTVISFIDPIAEELTAGIPIVLTFTTSMFLKIAHIEVKISLDAKTVDGRTIAISKDSFKLFTEGNKSMIVIMPSLPIKQELFVSPILPSTADPIEVTIYGLPTDVSVNAKLCGFDSQEWLQYKGMVGIS